METKPSVTAAVVASTLLLLRDDPVLGHLVDRGAEDAIEASVRVTVPLFGELLDRVPWPLLRRASYGVERLLSPGFIAHYALRKHIVRTELLRAVDDGFRQVVLLGAGFDMLASSLPETLRVFEVDLAATQAAKRDALRSRIASNVVFVPVDLTKDNLCDALASAPSFDQDARTVFVAEGLLMYLPASRVEALLRDIAGCTHDGVRAILSVITPDRAGYYRLHSQRRVVDMCMRWLEEPFVWGATRDEIGALVRAHGLTLESLVCTTERRHAILNGEGRRRLPRPTGELIVVAGTRSKPAPSPRA